MIEKFIEKIIVPEQEIQNIVSEMALRISNDYAGRELKLIGVLKGSIMFMSDLMRRLTVPVRTDFVSVSSYGAGVRSSGEIKLLKDLSDPIAGEHVLIVEDIIDTGLTLDYLVKMFRARNPASLRIAALLDKPARRQVQVDVHYLGRSIPPDFVCGYGLDYNEMFRNVPFIFSIKRGM